MKFTLAIFAVLAIASPLSAYQLPSTGSGQLAKDLQDIVDMIPFDKIFETTKAYLAQDKEVQLMAALVASPSSKEFMQYVENAPAVKKMMAFVQENGLDIYYLINKYNEFLQIPPYKPLVSLKREITGGIVGYNKDIVSDIPLEEMSKVLEKKIKTSKPLSELIKLVKTSDAAKFIESLKSNEFFLELRKQAVESGLKPAQVDQFYPYFAAIIPVVKSKILLK